VPTQSVSLLIAGLLIAFGWLAGGEHLSLVIYEYEWYLLPTSALGYGLILVVAEANFK